MASASTAVSAQLPVLTPLPASYGVPTFSASISSGADEEQGEVRLMRFSDRVLVLVQQSRRGKQRRGVGCLVSLCSGMREDKAEREKHREWQAISQECTESCAE